MSRRCYVNENMFLSWLTEALIDAGAEEPSGYVVEDGGPGQSSSITLLYASNPKLVIQEVEKSLHELVERL